MLTGGSKADTHGDQKPDTFLALYISEIGVLQKIIHVYFMIIIYPMSRSTEHMVMESVCYF